MSALTKVFIVLNSVLAIVLSTLTVSAAARWENTQEAVRHYQQVYQSESVARRNAEAVQAAVLAVKDDEIGRLNEQMNQQAAQLRDLSDELATKNLELARQTNERVAAEAGRKKVEEILAVQTAEGSALRARNQELLSRNVDLETRNQRFASRVLELTSEITISNDQIRNLQEKLYAQEQRNKELAGGAPSVTSASAAPSGAVPVTPVVAGPIRGEIKEINGRYVTLSIGESSGVVSGMTFMIYRGNVYVGDVRVEAVNPGQAGAIVQMIAPGQAIQPGDRVTSEVG